MKHKDLLNAMNDIEDRYIKDAEKETKKGKKYRKAIVGIATAAAACLVLVAGFWMAKKAGFGFGDGTSDEKGNSIYGEYVIAQAAYPESLEYPSDEKIVEAEKRGENSYEMERQWREERNARLQASQEYTGQLFPFYDATMREMLGNSKGENRVYSPLNLYMALSMMTELTAGESRAQIMALLNQTDMEQVRKSVEALWMANYSNDGMVTSLLANSLWLNEDVTFIPKTMQTLADTYRASSFSGKMGSEKFTAAFQGWINEQTGGLLAEQAEQLVLKEETILALVSTIYYQAQWKDRFWEGNTQEGIFHGTMDDITCDFMHQSDVNRYYQGDGFAAICRRLEESGGMWLFLPEEGVSVDQIISSGAVLKMFSEWKNWEKSETAMVNLTIPKFDISADNDLIETLKALGVVDIFDSTISDFSPMTKMGELYVDEAKHAARVMIDEDGCSAAAYTMMGVNEEGAPEVEEVDFTLDRPFLFFVTGADDTILFAGVVEEP